METDIKIAKQAQLCQIPVLIVRNKADQAIESKMRKIRNSLEVEDAMIRTTTNQPNTIHPNNSSATGSTTLANGSTIKMDNDRIWAEASGQLMKEVRKSIYRQMKDNKLSTKRLFTISAWNLQEFVYHLSKKQLENNLKLIDEQRFLRVLIEGVILKRKRELKKKKVEPSH